MLGRSGGRLSQGAHGEIMASNETVEFSRPIDVTRLGDVEVTQEIEANAAERQALARRFDLVAIDALKARVRLRRIRGGTALRLSGTLNADVVQTCVVSLAPVANHIDEDFTVIYASNAPAEEVAIGADPDVVLPEPMPEGYLDVGEAVAQQLGVSLDPYPRAPGATIDPKWTEGERERDNPFAKLATLKAKFPSSGRA